MECQISIKGSLSEIQQVLRVLTNGTQVLATIEETVGSMEIKEELPEPVKKPDPLVMLTPMGPLPIVKKTFAGWPAELKDDPDFTTEVKQVTPDRIPEVRKTTKSTGKREPVSGALQIHCHTCGNLFHPRTANNKHCSTKCYNVEWYEVNKKKKAPQVTSDAIPPVATLLSDEKAKALKEKLDKIKATCPAPTKRPDLNREIL
jgi:DNA-directed RNA polymerase subunit M/transcription elongation factor TFIIS